MPEFYNLPPLPYGNSELEPFISETQLAIHHDRHHQAYVKAANDILKILDSCRTEGTDLDSKSILKALSFNVGGHVLHSLFWENMTPARNARPEPSGKLAEFLKMEFGSFDRFRKEFTWAASSVEGSGWAALTFCQKTKRPMIMQIEKHNVNLYPGFKILMVLDTWEHAYYLDYKNERPKFIDAFWNIINWDTVEKRLEEAQK